MKKNEKLFFDRFSLKGLSSYFSRMFVQIYVKAISKWKKTYNTKMLYKITTSINFYSLEMF